MQTVHRHIQKMLSADAHSHTLDLERPVPRVQGSSPSPRTENAHGRDDHNYAEEVLDHQIQKMLSADVQVSRQSPNTDEVLTTPTVAMIPGGQNARGHHQGSDSLGWKEEYELGKQLMRGAFGPALQTLTGSECSLTVDDPACKKWIQDHAKELREIVAAEKISLWLGQVRNRFPEGKPGSLKCSGCGNDPEANVHLVDFWTCQTVDQKRGQGIFGG